VAAAVTLVAVVPALMLRVRHRQASPAAARDSATMGAYEYGEELEHGEIAF
jgi:hypothetical protein